MKKIVILITMTLVLVSCEKDYNDSLIGKWKLVEGFDIMAGGKYSVPIQEQRIEEYTENLRILYDFKCNEVARMQKTVKLTT